MTKEALKLALEALDQLTNVADTFSVSGVYLNEEVWAKKCLSDAYFAITAIKEALAQPEKDIPKIGCVNHDCDKCNAQPEQEPVAMKFKIYKPTVPDPTRQDINNALLPWVYDQDRSSGFDASMWVTPVSTLPPQRKPLTNEQIAELCRSLPATQYTTAFARAIEAAHGIKE